MRAAFALRILSGRIILNFAFGATAFAERSVAMKAPVGLLSGRAVCVSRWRGFAPTSSAERSKRIFTGGVWNEPSQSRLTACQLPRRGSFISANRQMLKSSPFGGAGERSEPERVAVPLGSVAATNGSRRKGSPQKKAACRAADSLFQKKIRKTRAQKGRVSIRTCFRPCSARYARTVPTRLRSRRGRRCAPDT